MPSLVVVARLRRTALMRLAWCRVGTTYCATDDYDSQDLTYAPYRRNCMTRCCGPPIIGFSFVGSIED